MEHIFDDFFVAFGYLGFGFTAGVILSGVMAVNYINKIEKALSAQADLIAKLNKNFDNLIVQLNGLR